MSWCLSFVSCVIACVLLVPPIKADETPKKLTQEERKELEEKSGLPLWLQAGQLKQVTSLSWRRRYVSV